PIQPTDYFVPTADGENLHVWRFEPEKPAAKRAVWVQFHGNAENQTSHFANLFPAVQNGYDLVTFDYRGYGQSTGIPSPAGTVEDGKTILRWVKKNYPDLPIVVFGQSLGGAIAMRTLEDLGNEVPIQFLVLDSTFGSYRAAGRS